MREKLKQVPIVGAVVFGFWATLYAAAMLPETEVGPLLYLAGVALGCAFVAAAIRMGGER